MKPIELLLIEELQNDMMEIETSIRRLEMMEIDPSVRKLPVDSKLDYGKLMGTVHHSFRILVAMLEREEKGKKN